MNALSRFQWRVDIIVAKDRASYVTKSEQADHAPSFCSAAPVHPLSVPVPFLS